MNKRTKTILLAVIAIVIIAAGSGVYYVSTKPTTSSDIVVGAAVSETGIYASAGIGIVEGYQLWVEHVNQEGGLLGRQVRLIVYDDMSDPTTTRSLYERLITVDHVNMLFGPYSSTCSSAMQPVAEASHMVVLQPMSTADANYEQGYNYTFLVRLGTSAAEDTEFFNMLNSTSPKPTTMGIIYDIDYFPESAAASLKAEASQYGMNVTFYQGVPLGTTDVTSVVMNLKAANPEVFVDLGELTDGELILRTVNEFSYTPKLIYAPDCEDPSFWPTVGSIANGVTISYDFLPTFPFPGVAEFNHLYQSVYNATCYNTFIAVGYTTGQLFEAAVKGTGSLNQDAIKQYLITHEVDTILGPWKLDTTALAQGEKYIPQCASPIGQYMYNNGTVELVWTPAEATAPLVYPVPSS